MWLRCALVSRTLETGAVAPLFSSGDDEQPASSASESAAAKAAWSIGLPAIRGAHQFWPAPPAAAERLKKCRGIGEPVGLGLDLAEPRLLVRLVGVEHREIGGIAVLVLEPGKIEAGLGGVGRRGGGFQSLGVMLERGERVGDILERGEHRAAILLRGLRVSGASGALLMAQSAAVEDRGEQSGAEVPEAGAGAEHLPDGERRAPRVGAERDVGQPVGGGDADF